MAQIVVPYSAKGLLTTLPRHMLEEGMFSVSAGLQLYQGVLSFAPGYTKYINQVLNGVAIMLVERVMRPDQNVRNVCFTTTRFYFENPAGTWADRTRNIDDDLLAVPVLTNLLSGGSLPPGTYGVVYTETNASGETNQSPEASVVVVGAANDDRISVALPPLLPGATGYKIYATSTVGSGWLLIGSTAVSPFVISVLPGTTPPPSSNTALIPYTGSQANPWITDSGPNTASPFIWYVATNGVDAVQKWSTATGAANFMRNLLGSPNDGGLHFSKSIAMYQACLFHLNRIEDGTRRPTKLKWSDANLIETYTGGLSGELQLFQGGFDQGVVLSSLGPYLVAYRRESVHIISFSGAPFFFSQRQVVSGKGIVGSRAFLNLDTRHLVLGDENVYAFNGVDMQPIGDDIRDQLFANIDPGNIDRSYWLWDKLRNVAELIVPSTTGGGTPDTHWFYNLTTGGWSGPILNRQATGGGNLIRTTSLTWADMTMTWDVVGFTWAGAGAIAGAPIVCFGNSNMIVYFEDPSTILADGAGQTARYESRSIHPGSKMDPPALETICVELLPLLSEGMNVVQWFVGIAENPQGPFTFYGPYTQGVRGLVKTQTIRGKWFVYVAQASDYYAISGLAANHQPSWINP